MKKKFKFHCVDDDSESYSESSEGEDESDDNEPEINVPSKALNSNNLITKKYLSDDDHLTPPPPLPSSPSPINDKKSDENEVDEDYPLHNINLNEESPPPPSLPDDLFIKEDEDPPPPDVEEVENADDEENNNDNNITTSKDANEDKTYAKKRKRNLIPKSLKRKNKSMSREDEFIACTDRIYEYFDHKIPKLTILKAIHAKCGDYRLAILALAHDPSQFNSTSLFQSPEADPEAIKKYLQL